MKPTKIEFLKWLQKQPKTRKFHYLDNHACLFASFLSERCKFKGVSCCGSSYSTRLKTTDTQFPTWMLRLSNRVCGELNCAFTISDVRKLLKTSN